MLNTTLEHLKRHGIDQLPEVVLADAGYWHTDQLHSIAARGMPVLVPPDGGVRKGHRPGWENGLYQQMRDQLATDTGRALYALRKTTIEPVYGQIKTQPWCDPVHAKRPGRGAVRMALDHRHPQPFEASQPLDRRHRLTHGGRRPFRALNRPALRPAAPPRRRARPNSPTATDETRHTLRNVPAHCSSPSSMLGAAKLGQLVDNVAERLGCVDLDGAPSAAATARPRPGHAAPSGVPLESCRRGCWSSPRSAPTAPPLKRSGARPRRTGNRTLPDWETVPATYNVGPSSSASNREMGPSRQT